jgi:protein AATF/BFR2
MLCRTSSNKAASSKAAGLQIKLWEKCLSVRIGLQKAIDVANRLPVIPEGNEAMGEDDNSLESYYAGAKSTIIETLVNMNESLAMQTAPDSSSSSARNKRKREEEGELSPDALWAEISETQDNLRPQWREVIDKWHSRVAFGTEKSSKLKSFNQSLWDQVEMATEDRQRELSRSRMPFGESRRLDKEFESEGSNLSMDVDSDGYENDDDDDMQTEKENVRPAGLGTSSSKQYDEEVYDDRQFYSMLLKTFITQSAGAASGAGGSMLASDLEALRKYKKAKNDVDRKATKGRKIRYVVHPKLQNFMFPQPGPTPQVDVDRLFQSLFQ